MFNLKIHINKNIFDQNQDASMVMVCLRSPSRLFHIQYPDLHSAPLVKQFRLGPFVPSVAAR